MTVLGYDPANAVKAHLSLERAVKDHLDSIGKKSRETTAIEELLSTHPRSKDRIGEIEKLLSPAGPRKLKGDGTGKRRFLEMTSGIKKTDTIYRPHRPGGYTPLDSNDIVRADRLASQA